MSQYLYTIIFLSFIVHSAVGQSSNKINELKKDLGSAQIDSAKFFTIDELANVYSRVNFDSAEFFNNQNLAFARRSQSDYYLGHALFRKGANHVFSNQLKEAVEILVEALEPIEASGDKWLEAKTHYYLGNLNYTTSNHSNAIYHYQISLVLSDSIGWPKGRIDNRHNLGGVFFDLEDYELAEQYMQEAKSLVDELGDYQRIPMTLAFITEVALQQKDYDKVDSVARIIIEMADTLAAAEYNVPPSYFKLGEVRSKKKEYKKAMQYFKQALATLNDPELNYPGPRDMKIGQANYYIGETYYNLDQPNIAKKFLLQADSIAKNLDHFAILRDASGILWQIEQEAGNYYRALEHHLNYKAYSDSILNKESLKKILKARVNYELEEREKEEAHRLMLIKLENRQRTLTYYWVIAMVILALIIVGLLFLLQKSKTKREMLSKEQAQFDLETKHRELASYVLQLLRKNELLMEVSDRLKRIRKSTKQDQQKELISIVQSIALNSKEIGWDEFELRFKEVHPTFYERLARHNPNLTSNENRLCAFLKLNMTSKEISAFTFQTEHSIVQARSRLKKKLGIEDAQRLSQFITTL